jgi:hypothetical protein
VGGSILVKKASYKFMFILIVSELQGFKSFIEYSSTKSSKVVPCDSYICLLPRFQQRGLSAQYVGLSNVVKIEILPRIGRGLEVLLREK